ncbi:MAG: gliding motility-associated C-terminal domain-containing protein, partial [Bacteroidales bacterium]
NLPMLDNATAGTYTVDITDANGCEYTEQVIITEPDPLELEESVTPVLCGINPGACGVSVSGGNGGYSYDWAGFSVNQPDIDGLACDLYQVTVEDIEGCSAQTSIYVPTQGYLTVEISEDPSITCHGESNAALNANCTQGASPLEYYWSTDETSDRIDNLSAGNYSVTINDSWGCSGSNTHTVIEPLPIVADFDVTNVACYGEENGGAVVSASGGTEPYTYHWPELSVTEAISDVPAGYYIVEITDSHACQTIDSVYVDQPDAPLGIEAVSHNITCYGDQDGRIAAGGEGGTPPYEYQWSIDNETTSNADIANLTEGIYHLMVRDDNGCSRDTNIMISQPAPLIVDYIYNNPSCIGNNDGYIELEVNGGTQPYTYLYDDATINLPFMNGLYEGNYDITVQDSRGCEHDLETISLMDVPEECLRIPNAFTPNGDGNNDTWIIENLEIFPNSVVTVYNRWGQELYHGEQGDEPWNGENLKGNLVPAGSYMYVIQLFNGSKPKSGIVTVVY